MDKLPNLARVMAVYPSENAKVYTSTDGIQVVYTNSGSKASVKNDDDFVAVPTPKATDAPTGQPDEEKSYTGTDKENKVHKNWHQVGKNKYTIE